MPFPGTVPTTTITKDYRDAQGNFPTATISFTPSQRKVVTAAGLTIEPIAVRTVVTAGQLSVVLARTDGFSYEVSELVSGKQRPPFSILVPDAGPYKLDELAPVEPEFDDYVPVRTVEGLGPDAEGNIDLPPSAGSDPAGTAAGLVEAHELTANPHPGYLTAAEADAVYPTSVAVTAALGTKENTGVAAGLVTAHEAMANPHPVYLTQAEADALYATIAGLATKATKPVVRQAYIVSGDVNPLPNTASAWAPLAGFVLAIPAAVGDYVELSVNAMRHNGGGNAFLDQGVLVGTGPGVIRRFLSSGGAVAAIQGDPGWYFPGGNVTPRSAPRGFTVTANDLDGTDVRFCIAVNTSGALGILYAGVTYPFYWRAINYGQVS